MGQNNKIHIKEYLVLLFYIHICYFKLSTNFYNVIVYSNELICTARLLLNSFN